MRDARVFVARGLAQYSVELDLTEQKAYLLYHERSVMESPICSGRPGHLTPTGTFHVTDKDLNHVSSIYGRIVDRWKRTVVADADVDMPTPAGTRFINAPMRYFMQFAPGIGMHAGYLPGYPASHGCVRMPEQSAIAFYQAVSVGTRVTVFGSIPRNRQYQVNNRTITSAMTIVASSTILALTTEDACYLHPRSAFGPSRS